MKPLRKRLSDPHRAKLDSSLDLKTPGVKLAVLAVMPILLMMCMKVGNTIYENSGLLYRQRFPYRFVWTDVLVAREAFCAKYNQPIFLPMGVMKRSGLTISEFSDLWDGKWPIIVTDEVEKWGAYQWSKEFLYKFYSQSNLTVVKSLNGRREGNIMTLGDFYRATFDKHTANSWLYATDEHFISRNPSLQLDVEQSKFLKNDYFSLFPDEIRPKNAMLLWGSKYSRSKLHVDPYNWTGALALLKGHKKWKMYPPGQDTVIDLKPQRSGYPLDCPQYLSTKDMFSGSTKSSKLPRHTVIEFIQNPGELLFIPTGWAHQAYNMEETLAISSQVMNKNNYRSVLEEVIQCTKLNDQLDVTFSALTPEEQITTVLNLLPPSLMEKARNINDQFEMMLNGTTAT